MRLLLDTHVFLWYISGDSKLAGSFRDAISDPNNEIFVSVVSFWEATIKFQIGKLPLPASPEDYLPAQRRSHQISSLLLNEESVGRLVDLPLHHNDPFDRILICQALSDELILVTVDPKISEYEVPTLNL